MNDARKLLLAIHDVSPRTEEAVLRLRQLLTRHGGAHSLALLVVPNHWGEAPIRPGTAFATRLRVWAERGDEIFLHGWYHRDHSAHPRATDRLRARWLTAGEGEFLGLDLAEARARLTAGRALLEDLTGSAIAGFVAPAWLYGPGAHGALRDLDFPCAEDHWRIWHPRTDATLASGPAITWASRSRWRIATSLVWATAARKLLERDPVVRIGVHPGDAGVGILRQSIAGTVRHFAKRRSRARYADLVPSGTTSSSVRESIA